MSLVELFKKSNQAPLKGGMNDKYKPINKGLKRGNHGKLKYANPLKIPSRWN